MHFIKTPSQFVEPKRNLVSAKCRSHLSLNAAITILDIIVMHRQILEVYASDLSTIQMMNVIFILISK